MKPKTAPTSPKYKLEKEVGDIWKEGQLQQPLRMPWGRLLALSFFMGFGASAIILVGLFWFVHAFPGSWVAKAIPSTVTTIVERTTTVNDEGVPKDVAERVASAFMITVARGEGTRYGVTDGRSMAVAISNNGWMLAVQPNMPDGDLTAFRVGSTPRRLTNLVRDTASIFAFVKTETEAATPVTFADVSALGRQGMVWVAEVTAGGVVPVRRQLVAAVPRSWLSSDHVERQWKVDGATPLMPGTPVFDERGRLFGLVTTENHVTDVGSLDHVMKTIIQRGELERPSAGFQYRMTSEVTSIDPAGPAGAIIGAEGDDAPLVSNGPAEKAGLQSGDVITHLDGRALTDDAQRALSAYVPGSKVTVQYARSGESKEATITLGVLRQ